MTSTRPLVAALAVTATLLVSPLRADVSPGDKITDANVDKGQDLTAPGLQWCIKHGFPLTIGETKHVEWPRAYKEATEKYASQVKLTADGRTMENYVAGQPFPNPDGKDPQFVIKVMYNYEYGYINGLDDTDLRNFDADTGAIADHGPMTVERHFLLDHFRRLFWTGRLYVDPKPDKPNPNGYRAQQGLYPILEPFDLKGVGALGNRYISSEKQDDSWLYLPSLRRVRRLSTAQRSDALRGALEDMGQRRELPPEGLRRRQRDRLRGGPRLHPGDRHGRHAARARDQGVAPEPALPGRAGLVLQPGREGGRHRGLVQRVRAGERGALIADPRLGLGSGTDSESSARWIRPTACRGRQKPARHTFRSVSARLETTGPRCDAPTAQGPQYLPRGLLPAAARPSHDPPNATRSLPIPTRYGVSGRQGRASR